MIAPRSLWLGGASVARTGRDFSHLADELQRQAVAQLTAALQGVTGKGLTQASVPGCGRHGVSRALNGDASNPLFRIAALFLVMKRLGMGRERALRILGWLREVVDELWPPEEDPALAEVVARDADLDVKDDAERVRVLLGDETAVARYLVAKEEQAAFAPVVIAVLRSRLAGQG